MISVLVAIAGVFVLVSEQASANGTCVNVQRKDLQKKIFEASIPYFRETSGEMTTKENIKLYRSLHSFSYFQCSDHYFLELGELEVDKTKKKSEYLEEEHFEFNIRIFINEQMSVTHVSLGSHKLEFGEFISD
ncbi:hypothetical protein [Pseudophaeobacter sp.]|uniref:hypothetical protein n=1 Tax=Pseudophaeobacter sp. TaxID=1971739 RepID=UPI003298FBC1